MRRILGAALIPVLFTALIALLAVDAWLATALFDATFHETDTCERGYDCNGGWLYWGQAVLAAGILVGLLWATWRIWTRLHASVADRFTTPT